MLEGTDALAPVYRQLIALSDHKMRRSALRTSAGFFFKRDTVWTPEGARGAADHVARIIQADPVYQALPKGIYRTRKLAAIDHQSPTSLAIQRSCQQAFEPEKATRYRTAAEGSPLDPSGETGARKRPLLVVAGSAHAAFAPANFDGFLSELTGLEVVNKSGADPSVYGSLIATVTDPAFKDAAPRYLVWEFPVEANLNFLSFVAFRQILPALQGTCDAKSASWREPSRTLVESGSFRIPDDRQQAGGKSVLRIATADRNVRTVVVKIRYRSGEAETIRLGAAGGHNGAGQFIASLSPEIRRARQRDRSLRVAAARHGFRASDLPAPNQAGCVR